MVSFGLQVDPAALDSCGEGRPCRLVEGENTAVGVLGITDRYLTAA
ncbi:MAG: hypothetical protein JWL97_3659, partial [Gemmatimonadales bacterium]|nr:hypothetical protein [Gemmatimonadales bacterium]